MTAPAVLSHLAGVLALALAAAQASAQDPQPSPPVFRAGTDLIAIDASVVDEHGTPVTDLAVDDFTVFIDDQPRRIVSAEFIRQEPPPPVSVAEQPRMFSTNASAVGGRLVLLVFDTEGIVPGSARVVTRAATEFIDELSPADRIGVLAFPSGVNVNFTANREQVRQALASVSGRADLANPSQYALGISEAFEIARGNGFALQRAAERECIHDRTDDNLALCISGLQNEARQMAVIGEQHATDALRVLRVLLEELRKIDAPKTVIWISEGLPLDAARVATGGLSSAAAAARTTVHALHLDKAHLPDVTRTRPTPTLMADRRLALEGLEAITGLTRGAVFGSTGSGDNAFSRIAREMTGYYLLSVEAAAADRDGRAHEIKVEVARPDTSVRARRSFTLLSAEETVPPVEVQITELLRSPLIATEVPLKVATHNMREPGDPKIRVVVSSEIGRNAAAPTRTAVGYLVTAPEGEVVATAYQERTLTPRGQDGKGPLQAVGVVAVPPGRYTLRLAVIDEDGRKGSVDHAFEAVLDNAGALEIADLLLFPASGSSGDELHASTDITLQPLPYSAYLELYPGGSRSLAKAGVVLEVAKDIDAPALTSAAGRIEESDGGRVIARGPLPLALLPPGEYIARAVVLDERLRVRQVRPFRIERSVTGELELGGALAATVGTFQPGEVLKPGLLGPALARARELDPGTANPETISAALALAAGDLTALDRAEDFGPDSSLLATFLEGLGLFNAGSFEEAAGQFRASVRFSSEFLPGIFYLGSCFAAGGRDREAVGAWQASLIGNDSIPEVFRLLADGFLRLGDGDGATSTLEEAAARWPDDAAWARRAAQARAISGDPGEALAALLAWVERKPDDQEIADLALRLAMTDLAGTGAGDPTAVARFRALVDRLQRSGRRPSPLAEHWLTYLDGRGS